MVFYVEIEQIDFFALFSSNGSQSKFYIQSYKSNA